MGHPPRLAGMTPWLACLLLVIATTATANKCTVGCHGMHPSKSYQEGHTYVYDLEGLSVTSVADAQGDATLKLKATVELSAKPNCIHQLRLKNVQLNGAPVPSPDVEQYAVQFNYHDGHIDTELCTEAGDSQSSLNIKRAVVSLFQSAVLQDSGSTTHHETDIFGACPTDFTFHKEGESLVVQKQRNLGQCAYRENINQGLISSNFDATAGVKSTPLLASQQKIEQRFKRGILNKAVSSETYKYRPFSNGEAGAKTTVETTLTLKGDKADNPTAAVSQPKSLIFEVPHPVVKSSVESITNALKAAKAELAGGVKPDAAGKFSDLVKTLRLSNKNDILSVYQKVHAGAGFDKVSDQKLFLDALFRAGSGEAAEVAVELIKNRQISGVQSILFYASLALVKHVNLPSVTAITSLLDQPQLPRLGYLGVGQVIGKYCQEHSCENVAEVKDAIHKIREKVGNGKTKTREQENLVISALKALGNTKYLDDATLQKVANIAADKNVRNRVRVAAIEALPTRCSMKWKNILFKVMADREEDSEVRIKTYLSMVACPCPHVSNQLKEMLDKETVNQVGSFIQSHLRNLRASTDPNKEDAKAQLGLIKPRTKFPEDFRKFSFNNELSYNIDAFGLGSSAESNVIYSQNSFVPRSANLNLTTELFGRSFNFLELSGRVENLDRMIERYFGPKGKLRQTNLEDLTETGMDEAKNILNYINERYQKTMRGKREVKQGELDRFAKNVHLRGNEVDQELDLDLSMKLFSVDLAYLSYHGDSSKFTPEYMVDKVFESLEKGFDSAKNFKYDLENYLHFLDAELVYPTGMGSALNLGVTGSSVVHLKTNGKFDIPAILKDPKNAAFHVALEPSVSIRFDGNMVVQGFGVESGMKVVSTLHTATSTDVSVSILDGQGVDVNFGIPKKKQELISLSSEVLLSSGPKGDKYVAPKFAKGKEYSDCFDQFSTVLGLTVCGHITFPYSSIASMQQKPFYPLSGPAKFAVTVENNDVNNYHFKVFYNTQNPKSRSFEILVDTPKSKTNRHVSLMLEGGVEPDKFAKISFDSPIKKASAEVVLKNKPEERTLTVTVRNDQHEYFARAGLLASGNKYKPVLEYKIPEHIERLASAKMGAKSGQQYNVEGTVDVSDVDDGKKFTFDKVALVSGGQKLVGVDGFVTSTSNIVAADIKIGYADESLALKLDGKRLAERNYAVALSAMPSKDPNVGFNLKWDYKRGQTDLDHKLVFVHGPDPNSEINRLTLEQNSVYKMDLKDFVLSTSNKLTYPAVKMVVKVEGKVTRKSVSGDVEVKYEKFKLGTELSAKANTVKPGDYEVEFGAEILENSVELKAMRTIMDEHKSKFKNSLVLSPGGKYDADATVTYDVSKNNINVQMDGDVNVNGKKVKIDTGLEANPQVVNSRAYITVDSVKYIEFLLKARRSPNPTGNLNLNLKNYLTANGQFGFQGGKGNGHLNIDIPKINRKIKVTGDLAVAGSEHVANVELLYDAEKDPSKRIKLSTISDITKTSIDTKNTIEVLTYKMEVNAKGELQGTINDGKAVLDMDVTLPNGRYVVYKLKRNSAKKDDKYDVTIDSEMIDHVSKGGKSQKLAYKAEAHDFNMKTSTGRGKAELKYVDYEGKDLVLAWDAKSEKPEEKKRNSELDLNLSGSIIPKPMKVQVASNCDDQGGNFKEKISLGNDFKLDTTGNYEFGNGVDKPLKWDGVLEMNLPNDKLRNLKLVVSESLLKPSQESGLFEYSGTNMLTYNDDKTVQIEGYLKLSGVTDMENISEGAGKITLVVLKNPPLTLGGSYKFDPTGEKVKASHSLNAKRGDAEVTIASDIEYVPDLSYVNAKAKITVPFEEYKNVDVQLTHKRDKDGKSRNTDLTVTTDNAKYTSKGEIQESENGGLFHFVFTCPKGKTELLSKFQKLGEREYKGEWKVDTPKGFVTADTLVNLESVDNFVINANFDSDKIKLRKIHAEIANKPTAKAGRRIVITVTSDGQNIVTGSTNYKKRDEDGKIVVEGNGNLKIGENTRSSSFKYTRQQLTRETDGEVGVTMVLNANFGPSAIVGELKLSNKEVHVFNSYCEQNKDCAHFKLQSTIDTDQKTHMKHQITVEVDLKKFNVPAEFGLKTSTEYKNMMFDHTASLYLHSSKDKSEYTYQVYAHPKESAVIMTLPSREMAVMLTFDLPKTKQTGAYKLDLSLYLDRKNKPNDKTSLLASGDVNVDKNSLSLNGEAKFIYPSQPKDMLVKGRLHYGGEHLLDANVDIDVFAKKSQKITIIANLQRQKLANGFNTTGLVEVNSRGQQLKTDLKSHLAVSSKEIGFGAFFSYNDQHQKPKSVGGIFSADADHVFLLVTAPNKEIIKSEWKMEFTRNLQKIDAEMSIAENKPIVANFEANDMNSFKYLQYAKDNPNTKLTANGKLVLGQLAEIHADAFKDGAKKNLFHVLIHLDEEKFLKPDFGYNKENIIGVAEYSRKYWMDLMKQLNDVSVNIVDEVRVEGQDLVDHLKKAQPNIKPLLDYYQTELNKLKEELHADETVKEIQAMLNKYFGAIIVTVTETMKQVAERLTELQKHFNEIVSKVKETFNSVYPQLKESSQNIARACMSLLNAIGNLGVAYLKAILSIVNEHQKELKELGVVVSEMAQDFAKIIFKGVVQIKQDVQEFVVLLINQAKALPIFEAIKEKYQELQNFEIPEAIISPIEEVCNTVKVVLPTNELREFFDVTCQYVIKHVKRQKVDEANEIKKIYSHAVTAVQSIISLLHSQASFDNILGFLQTQAPIDFTFLTKLPGISTLRLSVLNLLRNRELPTPLDLYYTYRPTLHVGDLVPPFSKVGIVADGGHFFTFDGRHFTMAGNCHYILAQDMQDGNFSVVANFNNGNLVSVTLTEPKESITLKSNGNILVNNKPADYPASTKNLHAYLARPFASVKSDYGVHLTCSEQAPMICKVRVSGFYLGKVRGIFGDGNNEPYDDFTLPSGKITESGTDFGNAYKLKADCPAATAVDHPQQRAPICTEYFTSSSSPMRSCFNYVNTANYREACDHAVAAGTQGGACLMAAAYIGTCYEQGIYGVTLPPTCMNCKVGPNNIAVGDSFSVKIPKKEADIVFVVEQLLPNEKIFKEMVGPLMSELRDELKHQGITDVHIGVIGFSEKMKWPQHYTVNGKVNIEGDIKNMKFEEKEPIVTLQEAKKGNLETKMEYVGQRLDVEFGTFKLTDAYEEAIRYPFRPGAAKAVIGVIAAPCEKSPLPISMQQVRLLLGQKIYRDLGLTYYHVSFPNELLVSGKPQKNIVGYDHDNVYTFADSKKKPLGGSSDMKSNLAPSTSDVCADFAVSSGGAAFSSDNFLEAKPNQRKQFIQVAARRVVEGLVSVEIEEDCLCQQHYGLVGRPRCKIVGRKEKEPLARQTKGGAKA